MPRLGGISAAGAGRDCAGRRGCAAPRLAGAGDLASRDHRKLRALLQRERPRTRFGRVSETCRPARHLPRPITSGLRAWAATQRNHAAALPQYSARRRCASWRATTQACRSRRHPRSRRHRKSSAAKRSRGKASRLNASPPAPPVTRPRLRCAEPGLSRTGRPVRRLSRASARPFQACAPWRHGLCAHHAPGCRRADCGADARGGAFLRLVDFHHWRGIAVAVGREYSARLAAADDPRTVWTTTCEKARANRAHRNGNTMVL